MDENHGPARKVAALERQRRLEAALRSNLQRRKEQQRRRAADPAEGKGDGPRRDDT